MGAPNDWRPRPGIQFERAPGLETLTPKERECLRLVAENRGSKDIARLLGISPTSVETHVRRAREKLGTRDRFAAARLLVRAEEHLDARAARGPRQGAPTAGRFPPAFPSLDVWSRFGLVLLVAAVLALIFRIGVSLLRAL